MRSARSPISLGDEERNRSTSPIRSAQKQFILDENGSMADTHNPSYVDLSPIRKVLSGMQNEMNGYQRGQKLVAAQLQTLADRQVSAATTANKLIMEQTATLRAMQGNRNKLSKSDSKTQDEMIEQKETLMLVRESAQMREDTPKRETRGAMLSADAYYEILFFMATPPNTHPSAATPA